MRIGILTSFRRMPDSYSLVNDVRDQIRTLVKHGHEVVFFAQETCEGQDIDCEMRAILPHFRLEKDIENKEAKEKLIEIFKKELTEFDVVITHDLLYIRQYFTYRKAIMECGIDVKWVHWVHSGIGETLKLKMPHAKYVTMNYADSSRFAEHIGVTMEDVRVVFNDKDPRLFFDWNPITRKIADKYDLFNKDIIQTYPMCTTRMDAKGIDHVIRVFASLKKIGNNVLLIIANSNGRKKQEEIDKKLESAYAQGLEKGDIVFTSSIGPESANGVPRDVVRDLMLISNLFIFPSISEVCPNVLLEASITKQLIVVNRDFPALFDFAEDGKTCLAYDFGSLIKSGFRYRTADGYDNLAKEVNEHLVHSKINQQFLKIKRVTNIDTIYNRQLEPLLYEKY